MNNRTSRSIFRRPVRLLLVLALAATMLLSQANLVGASNIFIEYPYPEGFSAGEMVIQSDGKIVVSGNRSDPGSDLSDFLNGALVRFNSDGSLDNSYDSDAMLDINLKWIRTIAIQTGDRIIVAGETFSGDSTLVRYNPDGSLDTNFNVDVMPSFHYMTIAIQPDDKIVLGTCDYGSTDCDFALARYNSDGSPDAGFNVNDRLTIDNQGSIAFLSNGKIVVAGERAGDFAVALYNPDGSLDTGFDTDGLLTTDFAGGEDFVSSVSVQSDDKIIVAGSSDQGGNDTRDFAMARYNLDGSLDTSFDNEGLLTTDYDNRFEYIKSIAIQPDGKIIAAGSTVNPEAIYSYYVNSNIALARYLPSGELDTSFGTGGKYQIDLTPPFAVCCYDDGASEVAIGADGTIIVGGASSLPAFTFEGGRSVLLLIAGDSNQAPELDVNNASVTVNEGQIVTNSGTVSDVDGDAFTLTSSIGSITDNNNGTWSWSYTPDDGPASSQTVTITADDGNVGTTTATFELTVNNVAPTASFAHDGPVGEGDNFTLSLANSFDPSSADTGAGFEYAFDCGDGAGFGAFSASSSADCPTDEDGVRAVRGQIRDKDGGLSEYSADVPVNNLAPTIVAINGPADPVQVGTIIDFTAEFTDPGVFDTHSALWDWGDNSSDTVDPASSPISSAHTYTEPGVFTISLTVSDDDGGTTTNLFEYAVVYDSGGAFVTGAGMIDSPAGAFTPDPSLSGKATFGFVSKYKKGAAVPTGNTEFRFKVANLTFQSNSYDWLVVTGNNNVSFKGAGTINGSLAPNGEAYKFMIWAGDGEPDTFRIRIWYEENEVEFPIYDNGVEQAIRGGSIVVHK